MGFFFLVLTLVPCFAGSIKGDAKRGKSLFQNMQCELCHHDGYNNLNPERPLRGPGFLKRFPVNNDQALGKVIREGISSKGMPEYGKDKMSDQDLADIIAFIRSLTPSETKKKSN